MVTFYHNEQLLVAQELWNRTIGFKLGDQVTITGKELDVATVVAVSRGYGQPILTSDETTIARINESVSKLNECLKQGQSVYGVNTGFGGSADSRTSKLNRLQVALLQLTQSGVLLESDKTSPSTSADNHTEAYSTPISWVRAAMLVRCNSTVRGHSAVTIGAIQAILRLLRHNITPIVPLRGTVSASGDLMPLAYVAGTIEGNPDIAVRKVQGLEVLTLSAEEALAQEDIPKVVFGPKEALGLVNGTASSAALASLVMYDAHHLAVLSQAFTAMAVEALLGSSESFHPFIGQVRPHTGQIEASRNILAFLNGSHFARGMKFPKDHNLSGLAQDRYALRSAPQWIGPQLEDLLSAQKQVTIELNSSSDNPLVDIDAEEVYNGANFQAAAITSAMEKMRLALQMLGRLLFSQSTELIDPNLNNGLPTNLAADNPSTSFTMKGVDINMAAYMSELAFFANPVSSHVLPAEMGNQSINSLAFLSARMTKKAVELLSLMMASCLYIGCQALDLRALQVDFLSELQQAVKETNQTFLDSYLSAEEIHSLDTDLEHRILEAWRSASRLDLPDRVTKIGDAAVLSLMPRIGGSMRKGQPAAVRWDVLESWRFQIETKAAEIYNPLSSRFFANPSTEEYLGAGSKALYQTVRHQLGVPFHQGLVEHPGTGEELANGTARRPKKTVGSWISIIYEAILDGKIYGKLYDVTSKAAFIVSDA